MNEPENSTLEAILSAAEKEFLEKGYQRAGLRDIVKKAGVTTGALYGYFRNKAELFEAIVGDVYNHTLEAFGKILYNFSQLTPAQQKESMVRYTTESVYDMLEYMYERHDKFKLILCCSEGTKFCNYVHELAKLEAEATHAFMETMSGTGVNIKTVNPKLEHMLISGMFSTFFELIIHDIPKSESYEYVNQLIDFYSAGWAKIMGE